MTKTQFPNRPEFQEDPQKVQQFLQNGSKKRHFFAPNRYFFVQKVAFFGQEVYFSVKNRARIWRYRVALDDGKPEKPARRRKESAVMTCKSVFEKSCRRRNAGVPACQACRRRRLRYGMPCTCNVSFDLSETSSKRIGLALTLGVLCLAHALPSHAAAPTFQDLMSPSAFPDAQRGMTVEEVKSSADSLKIVTTGAECSLDATGQAVFRQRIGHPRELLRLRIKGLSNLPKPSHQGPGFAFASVAVPKLDLRVNGDSLFMFHAHEPVALEISRSFDAGWAAVYKSNAVVLDEWGGFGLFCSDPAFAEVLHPQGETTIRYTLPADAVLWIGLCPPKPYDWDRSYKDHVVWHWSKETGYPTDTDLKSWASEGNFVLLQSEVMLWKDWNLAFEPRLGPAEFERVRNTIHGQNMRFIVYTSPYYFLKGTPIENTAMNSFENFEKTGFPSGWADGRNIDLFLNEIAKVMTQYKPDGLYFDGQYTENVPALYALARHARGIVGENGLLEWHSTAALGDGLCFLPQADAYVDFILRGEGRDANYTDADYLRYFVSGYNSSNSIGVLCNNSGKLTPELVHNVLDVNARMHTLAGWLSNPQAKEIIHAYRAQLGPALRERVEQLANERQAALPQRAHERTQEYQALHTPPKWTKPAMAASGADFLSWTPSVSPLNKEPFAETGGTLAIMANASTYAFFTHPLDCAPAGFLVKLKQGSDGGMAWGPAVCIRWKSGAYLRVGSRSDGLLQADVNGQQRLFGHQDSGQWLWIRARWLKHGLVVETSTDDERFAPVWQYEHGGAFQGIAENISVGKIPYNAQAIDHTDPGPAGTCWIESVAVYHE